MDWAMFFNMQKDLDDYIEKNHNLTNKNLFKEKCLALQVELSELANETRCFKFWSTKSSSAKETITEEYVDGIHFIMSLGLEQDLTYTKQVIGKGEKILTDQFIKIYKYIIDFMESPNEKHYHNLFKGYLQLGELLNITEAELQDAYIKKNDKNYARQNEGY